MVIERIFGESDLEEAAPGEIIAGLQVKSDGDEGLDAGDGEGERPEGGRGGGLGGGGGLCRGGRIGGKSHRKGGGGAMALGAEPI